MSEPGDPEGRYADWILPDRTRSRGLSAGSPRLALQGRQVSLEAHQT